MPHRPTPNFVRCLALLVLGFALASCSKEARRQRVLNRAEAYFAATRYDQAKVEYLNLLRLDLRNPLPYQRLGAIWFAEGAPLRAAPFLLKARELAPNDVDSRLKLAHVFVAVGHRGDAFTEAMNLLQRSPNNGEAAQIAAEAAEGEDQRKQADQAIANIPDQGNASVQLALATAAMARGDSGSAKKALQNAIAADPKSAMAHVFLGTLLLAERQTAGAGAEFKLAAELSPPRSAERLRYAQFQLRSGTTEDALKTLRDITSVTPDFLPAWLLQAEIALSNKNYAETSRLLANVLNRDPENLDASVLQARTWMATGEGDKALQTLQRLDTQYPDFAPLKLELARAYLQKNNLPQATTLLEQALNVSPDYVDAALLLGQLNLRTGKAEAVAEAMKKLVAKHPEAAAGKLLLADAYRALGRLDDAANIFRERLNVLPNDVEASIALGIILRQQKKNDEARELLERAQHLTPANTLPLVQLVDLDVNAGNFDSAHRRIEEQMEITSNPAVLHLLQGKVYVAEKKWDRAEVSLTKAINLNSELTAAYELLATVDVALNKIADAAHQLEIVIKRAPDDSRVLMILGGLYEKLHDLEKARDVYERVITIAPDSAPALNNLAFIYAENFGQLDRAYQLAKKARGLQPGDGSIADTLGWVFYKKRDYGQALELLGEAVAKSPKDPEIRYHLGMCQYMMGDAESARTAFDQAMRSSADFPHRDDAQRRLALLSKWDPLESTCRHASLSIL